MRGANLVAPAWGCPACGQRDADRLVIGDDDGVVCLDCGTPYRLPGAPTIAQPADTE